MEEEKPQVILVRANDEGNTTGYDYDLYVPANVNANTPVHLYIPGSGGSQNDPKPIIRYLDDVGSDSIVIMPRWDSVGSGGEEKYANRILTISDAVAEKYGLNATNVSVAGFSNGGSKANYTAYLSLGDNYKTKVNQVIDLDGGCRLTETEMQKLISKGVVLYSVPGKVNTSNFAAKYAKLGGVAIRIDAGDLGHARINSGAYSNGIIDFLAGNGDLAGAGDFYKFSMFNVETGKWEEISYDEAKKIAELQNGKTDTPTENKVGTSAISIETVKSDNSVLQGYMDSIHEEMRNTQSMPFTPTEYMSTTSTPNNNGDVVSNFFKATESLLNKLASDTNYILTIGSKLQEMDANLKNRLETLPEPNQLAEGSTEVSGSESSSASQKRAPGEVALNIGKAALAGAVVGTMISPGLGTAIGLGVGAVAGTVITFWDEIKGFFNNLGSDTKSDTTPATTPAATPAPVSTATPQPTPTAPQPTPTPDLLGTE